MKAFEDKIRKLFAGVEGNLNAGVKRVELQKTEDGTKYFETVVPYLSDGGATVVVGKQETVALEPPAVAEFTLKKVHPVEVVYRIAFTLEDAAKAAEDDGYFNLLCPPIMTQAVARYIKEFGNPEDIRYGRHFCIIDKVIEGGTHVEVRLSGNWASNAPIEVK